MVQDNKTVLDLLKEKHPPPSSCNDRACVPCNDLPSLTDVDITSAHIEKVARMIHGGAGPSGSTAIQWQGFLLHYGAHSGKLRDSMAELARQLSNSIFEWSDIHALMANRLIALDKCPGVRPIGIGEEPRRILGKAIALATRYEVEDVCGASQLCSGLKSGIEGAVHALREVFAEKAGTGWGVLLIDAKNAFNSLNRVTALWNARILWPQCSRFLFNTYRGHAALIVHGSNEYLFSREGVTQGDPLSMLFYAVAILPLIESLSDGTIQSWYADDSSCVANLKDLRVWFDKLCDLGPDYGYYPEPSKSFLVIDPSDLPSAQDLFRDTGVQFVSGHRFLGGYVGDSQGSLEFVQSKVNNWVHCIECLARAAESQPQAAYAALKHSLQFEWSYLSRVVPDCGFLFNPLKSAITDTFWPALFEDMISDAEESLFFLPTRLGGLGVNDPVY